MEKHLRYLKYVIRHKWLVFVACLKWRDPLLVWRGIIHDWQKLTRAEWGPYVWSFYGPYEYDERPVNLVWAFDRAWLHHQHKGPHHWQYWVLREDSGETKALAMPMPYVKEMLADWSGAGKAIANRPDPAPWYEENKDKIILHKGTRDTVERLLRDGPYAGLK